MIKIGARPLSVEDVYRILYGGVNVDLDPKAIEEVHLGYLFLKDFAKRKLIYGINTGFGPMAQYRIEDQHLADLQYNLIRSHASGMGNPIPDICVKSLMIARLQSLAKGYSGIHEEVCFLLKEFINRDICPLIYEHGGVGASGDLVQLAHLALSLIGEGKVSYKGEVMETRKAMDQEGLSPITIRTREGLALLN